MEKIYTQINQIKISKNLENNLFFNNLNKISINEFLQIQKEFIYAVNYWSQLLFILLSKINDPKLRLVILDNINDEHGHGIIENSHVYTFHDFLQALGHTDELNINKKCKSKSVKLFYKSLKKYIKNLQYYDSVLILGAIEYTYIDISTIIIPFLY